jgi:single-stranded-DNA-specific exonuclease
MTKWILRAHDAHLVEQIERSAGVSPVVARILALRGITSPGDVNTFLELKMTGLRSPAELPGLSQAVEVIYSAVTARQKIFIYGDYDADGMTSTAIMYRCLVKLGADVSYFVPNRLDDGYGVNSDSLRKLRNRGAELIVTVDCGIGSVAEVQLAHELGMKIVVTDHHQVGNQLPAADAVVHPALPGCEYPFGGLCGAGVAFKLAWAMCQRHCGCEKLPAEYRELLFGCVALAAIGTVADVVPLLDENRIIVHHGLNYLRAYASVGLTHLMRLAKLDEKPRLEAEDIAFMIGPRLNAAGRLGQAQLGVELLICQSEERAISLSNYIDRLNQDRDTIDRRILKSARQLIHDKFDPQHEPALVLAHADWHLGVIGIAAGRIAERYNRPTILISTDSMNNRPGVGSCRTACGVNLYRALAAASENLISFGGHPEAAGLAIEPDRIDAFREDFCEQVVSQVGAEELIPDLEIDAEALICEMTLPAMNELQKLAPFGQKNPRPVLCATGVQLAAPPTTMGSDGRHISLQLKQHKNSIRAVGFGKSEWLEKIDHETGIYDFAFKPVINEFRGFRKVELHLIDFRPTESAKPG